MKFSLKNFFVMLAGIVLLSLGIALFKMTLMGNDPSSAFVMAVGDKIHIDFSIVLIICNLLWFVVEIIWGRKMIGIGTFVNWFFVGTIASLFVKLIGMVLHVEDSFPLRILVLVVGVLILSLGASMYQTADMGIAPYDALSLILSKKTPIPYFWCRIMTDGACALLAFLLGGIVGIGTLICAIGLGPFITFFNKNISEKICDKKEK